MAFIEPGHFPLIMLTPAEYQRMLYAQGPNLWPVYFGARMAAHTFQDLAMKKLQADNVDALKRNIDLMLGSGLEVATDQAAAGPTGDVGALRDEIERLYGGLYDNWKAGVWHGVGGAYSSAMDDFLQAGQLMYAFKTLAYHVAVTPRMRRHWNRLFTPNVPSGNMAWILYRRGIFTEDQWKMHAAYDGWSAAGAGQLARSMNILPTPREAFFLWVKGQITQAQRDQLYFAGGYDSEWWTQQTENWYYTLTLYDLTRLADYVELDQIWTLDQLKRRGLKDYDRAKVWEMLRIRPLRDEMRAITGKWLWRYKYGRATEAELTAAFLKLELRPKERELLLVKAKMDYEDELIDEWVEILRWRFRTAVISDEEFLDGLIDLGICEEKANLIVEGEKAKGYYGYY